MNKISVLQVGNEDLSLQLHIPDYVDWNYTNDLGLAKERGYDVCVLNRCVNEKEARILLKKIRAYTLFLLENVELDYWTEWIYKSRVGKIYSLNKLQEFVNDDIKLFFSSGYGEKFDALSLSISQSFNGSVSWDGYNGVLLNGEYGDDFYQIAYWKMNVPLFNEQVIDFWLEYEKDPTVNIQLKIEQFQSGSISTVQNRWIFNERDLESMVSIENKKMDGTIFVSLLARGKGKLKIINLHDHHSRKSYGAFFPGGVRYVTSKREEVFMYFDPGDMKPPLCVYFGGWKTMESFEGFNMMRRMGTPFLLITESRVEGGAYYLGDKEYEKNIIFGIKDCLKQLGFTNKQLVISGLSMGSIGSLYYGSKLEPHTLLLGKPVMSVGTVAANERIKRPWSYPTSLDVLAKHSGDLSEDSVEKFNSKMWDAFDNANWNNTILKMAYMIEDDYDMTAYHKILSHIHNTSVEIIGKGIHGRHNDDTTSVVQWFLSQYNKTLQIDFNRGEE